MFGTQGLILILVIVVVLFGGKKLPELGKGIGQAIGGLKRGMSKPDEVEAPKKDVSTEEKTEKKEGE